MSFAALGVAPWLLKICRELNYENPTPIQASCVPAVLEGKHVIGMAETGSGKTAAFGLPMLQKFAEDPFAGFGLVLSPTRELALQIAEQLEVFGAPLQLRIAVVIGGRDMIRQALQLDRKPHIIVATPGRLADHICSTHTLKLNRLRFLVLDEADRMLDAGFGDEMKNICAILPKTYQLLLFSATMSSEMEERARQVTGRADVRFTRFGTAAKATVPASLTQSYLFMPPHVKLTYLVYLMKTFGDRSCIVFVDRCRTAELLRAVLKELGVSAVSLHSQLPQESRSRALTAFRSAVVSCLIATDVASRGLDIPQVEYVISYDLPLLPQTYLHRVGRAGRAGRPGHAIALLSPRDIPRLHEIEETIGVKLAEHAAKEEDIMQYLSPTAVAEKLAQQSLVDTNFGELRRSRKRRADQAET